MRGSVDSFVSPRGPEFGSTTVVLDPGQPILWFHQFSQSEPPAEAKGGKVNDRGSWGNSSTYRSSRLSSTSVIIGPISPSNEGRTKLKYLKNLEIV